MIKEYEVVLQPNRSWTRIDWRSLIEFRDLLLMLVWRDYSVKHKQTILGPLWIVLNPLLTTLIFAVVFGGIARIPTDGLPPMLFYLCGLLGWNYFARTMQGTSSTFVTNAKIFEKVYFPRLILPLSTAVSNLVAFAIQFASFAAVWLIFKLRADPGTSLALGPEVLLLPLLILHTAALAVGVGLWVASVTAKYRDLLQMIALIIQLWMYATPVIYPLSQAPDRYLWIMAVNPMAQIVEAFRVLLLGQGTIDPVSYAISAGTAVLVLISGIMIFQRTERTVIDTI